MSWCGGGEISPTPGVEWRTRAIALSTLWPGNWPPSPGFAPCAILICKTSALTRYSAVTPNRPEATCLIAERIESPLGSHEPNRNSQALTDTTQGWHRCFSKRGFRRLFQIKSALINETTATGQELITQIRFMHSQDG